MPGLFSPSQYKKFGTDRTNSPVSALSSMNARKAHVRKPRRTSMMDMLGEAHREAKTERLQQADQAYARNLHHQAKNQRRKEEEERARALKEQEQYAQKLQLEEEDSALAEQMYLRERALAKKEQEEREAAERESEEKARELHEREAKAADEHSQAMRKLSIKDEKLAKKTHKQEMREAAREAERARKLAEAQRREEMRVEKASEALARKLQCEEEKALAKQRRLMRQQSSKDEKIAKSSYANELKEIKREEMQRKKEEEAKRREEARMLRMEQKSAAMAAKMQAAENSKFIMEAEARKRQHEKDLELARKMQSEELGEAAVKSTIVQESWSNPKVEVEETKSGCIITVQLPNVRRMEVDLDEEENAIFVNAIPKSSDRVARKVLESKMSDEALSAYEANAAHDELKRIVKHSFVGELKPVSFEINLADIVEGIVCAEDIKSQYKAEEGLLSLELEGVVAVSKKRQQRFRDRLLGRLGGLFKKRRSKGKENKK